jgi:hypothetical protein
MSVTVTDLFGFDDGKSHLAPAVFGLVHFKVFRSTKIKYRIPDPSSVIILR